MVKRIFNALMLHKIATATVIIVLAGCGYYGYNKIKGASTDVNRYVLAQAVKGTIITSITGSGQVSASNQVDIKPQASGNVVKINVISGQEVKTGDLLAQLDAKTAQKSVRDAEINLKTAQLSLTKLKQPASTYSILQAENALENAKITLEKLKLSQATNYQDALQAEQTAADNITTAYNDAYNAISNAYLDLPDMITDLYEILYSNGLTGSGVQMIGDNISILKNSVIFFNYPTGFFQLENLIATAENNYDIAREKYDENFSEYQNSSRYSDQETIGVLLSKTLETATAISELAKSEANIFDYWVDYRSQFGYGTYSQITTYQTNLGSYISQANGHITDLSSEQTTIESDKNALTDASQDLLALEQNNPLDLAAAEASVKEKQASLDNLKVGTDPLDIQSQELSLQQKQNALTDAYNALADYSIKAPFAGVIAAVNLKIGDAASASTAAFTLITKQSIAEISLNEVDVAKVSVTQKATLTFDAVSDLNISGEVVQVDSIGTVSQGVVTYNVKIAFDTQDGRIKPGMSVNASIITDSKQDVLTVPNAAIKTQGESRYVLMFLPPLAADLNNAQGVASAVPPAQQTIEIGLANDSYTEITSGLNEGDQIIIRTISPGASAASGTNTDSSRTFQQSPSIFGGGGEPPR